MTIEVVMTNRFLVINPLLSHELGSLSPGAAMAKDRLEAGIFERGPRIIYRKSAEIPEIIATLRRLSAHAKCLSEDMVPSEALTQYPDIIGYSKAGEEILRIQLLYSEAKTTMCVNIVRQARNLPDVSRTREFQLAVQGHIEMSRNSLILHGSRDSNINTDVFDYQRMHLIKCVDPLVVADRLDNLVTGGTLAEDWGTRPTAGFLVNAPISKFII